VLLFVFWYCHKRGKEVRLEKERELTEQEVEQLDQTYRTDHPDEVFTTTADPGADFEEVKAGIAEAREAKQSAALDETATPDVPTAKPDSTPDMEKTG
jgi:HJR/Mrr/RecB family endonuclease